MLRVKNLIRFAVLLLVLVSGSLLGMSLGNVRLMLIAIIGATLGFLITDYYKLIRLDGILANVASVGILVLAMKDFLPGDSTAKLVSVANLLVYLQTVLMFQLKTPRLVWQILVLSLLQVVVAAIFSLNFEGGLLFLLYFFIAGATLALQAIYSINFETIRRNQTVARQLGSTIGSQDSVFDGNSGLDPAQAIQQPVIIFDPDLQNYGALHRMLFHLGVWMGIGLMFTTIMFCMIPRHAKPWFGPNKIEVPTTGFSKSVDLENRDRIRQSNQLIFRATFEGFGENKGKSLVSQPPYFRGMALSHLVIENDKTNWRSPNDRIWDDVYQDLTVFPNRRIRGIPIKQIITMEETSDSLVHAAMPAFSTEDTPYNLEFCHEVSGLTRCRISQEIDLMPYKYELGTFVKTNGHFYDSWPYVSNSSAYQQKPMSEDEPQQRWLTSLEKSRYPRLVKNADMLAERIRNRNPNATRMDIIRAFEEYFKEPLRYRYTLDFTNVNWTEGIDPVEDFVQNHRTGHCELFASAMTLMLRSQGIPARLVVGFHGGEMNVMTGSFMVRGKHAHAWVEAYLRPEDCTSEMLETGEAGPGGAWLLADPTPPSVGDDISNVGADAIDLARSMWQDYVLGMDSQSGGGESNPLSLPIFRFLQRIDIENFEASIANLRQSVQSKGFRYLIAVLVVLPFLVLWIFSFFRNIDVGRGERRLPAKRIRRMVAGAISLISPSLGKWVLDAGSSQHEPTAFYRKMSQILEPRGLKRQPTQTHREFAREVSQTYSDHPSSSLISSTVHEITEIFNDVRFGKQVLPADLKQQISASLNELENGLAIESVVMENRTGTSGPQKSTS